jgi:hypothetical protein
MAFKLVTSIQRSAPPQSLLEFEASADLETVLRLEKK